MAPVRRKPSGSTRSRDDRPVGEVPMHCLSRSGRCECGSAGGFLLPPASAPHAQQPGVRPGCWVCDALPCPTATVPTRRPDPANPAAYQLPGLYGLRTSVRSLGGEVRCALHSPMKAGATKPECSARMPNSLRSPRRSGSAPNVAMRCSDHGCRLFFDAIAAASKRTF